MQQLQVLNSSIFEIHLAVGRVKEYEIYKDERRDPNARDIFWGRVETLRLFLDKLFTKCYYENLSSELIIDLFLIVLQILLREIPLIIDDILTPTLDKLLKTNIRILHKSGNYCPIFLIYQHILMNHTTKLIHTSNYLEKYDLQYFSTMNSKINEKIQLIRQLSFPPLQSNYQRKKHNYYNRMTSLETPEEEEQEQQKLHVPILLPDDNDCNRQSIQNNHFISKQSESPSTVSLPPIKIMLYKQQRRR